MIEKMYKGCLGSNIITEKMQKEIRNIETKVNARLSRKRWKLFIN